MAGTRAGCSRNTLSQILSHPLTEGFHFVDWWRIAGLKHGALHCWPRSCVDRLPVVPDPLHYEMDMPGSPSSMRPRASVDLVGVGKGLDSFSYALEERAEFLGFRRSELSPMWRQWRTGLTIRVPTPSGSVQCSTTQCAIAQSLPPGNGSSPSISRQAWQSELIASSPCSVVPTSDDSQSYMARGALAEGSAD
jgi:hypothetical protein